MRGQRQELCQLHTLMPLLGRNTLMCMLVELPRDHGIFQTAGLKP
jgi:hypothetical protein